MNTTDVSAEDGDHIELDDTTLQEVANSDMWPNRRILGSYLSHIMSHVTEEKGEGLSYSTYETRRGQMRRLHSWLDDRGDHITDMTSIRLESFFGDMNSHGYQPNTVAVTYDGVTQFYRTLRDKFGIDVSELNGDSGGPLAVTKKDANATGGSSMSEKGSGNTFEYVTKDEKDEMLKAVPEPDVRNKLIIQLLWETGFRRSTLANTELDGIDRDDQRITAYSPKAKEDVTTGYSDAVEDHLSMYLDLGIRSGNYAADTSDRLFLGYRGNLTGQGINLVVKEAAENAGIQEELGEDVVGRTHYRVTAHTLRHSHAHHLLIEKGWSLPEVKQSLNHSDISITQTYTEQHEDEIIERLQESGTATRTTSL